MGLTENLERPDERNSVAKISTRTTKRPRSGVCHYQSHVSAFPDTPLLYIASNALTTARPHWAL
eukprot:SAG31_NODE_37532_length_303_cov_1.004902_1_plen_63_part_01